MIFLTGDTSKKEFIIRFKELGIGRLFTTKHPKPYDGEKWGLDNGAYSCWKNDTMWYGEKFLHRVDKAYEVGTPYMAVLPDKPTQPDSLDFSLAWLDQLPDDWPWYFCLQDGMNPFEVRKYVCSDERIKGLFLGGTHKFKDEMGQKFLDLSKEFNIGFHLGRTSSVKKIVEAYDMGCTSCDSTFFLWNQTRMDAVFKLVENGFKTSQMRMINSFVISHETI